MNGPQYAVPEKRTFLPTSGREVFLCCQAAEKDLQLCSRSLEPFNVQETYASGLSLPAAALAVLFEHPAAIPLEFLCFSDVPVGRGREHDHRNT